MSQQALVDKILETAKAKVAGEVGGLLGTKLVLSDAVNRISSKGDFFQATEKIVLSKLKIEGEQEGEVFLVVSVKDAILLGGTLIMLPAAELESHISTEEINSDESDAFGEIANIIAGVYSATFEELYPKKSRFVKTGIEVLDPKSVTADSADPFPEQTLYVSSFSMNMDGKELGEMQMLFPADLLELDTGASDEAQSVKSAKTEASAAEEKQPEESVGQDGNNETATKESAGETAQAPSQSAKHSQASIDKVLEAARAKIGGEVGGLLGTQLKTTEVENKLISKADFFKKPDKIVHTKMRVEGEREGETHLAISLKDAILFGGALIMLPEAELDNQVNNEEFGADISDAFGEIANIISGIYSSTFEELFPDKIRFIRDDFEVVEPSQVEIESATPFPDQQYYMSSYSLEMDGKQLGDIQVLFPADLLGMDVAGAGKSGAADPSVASQATKAAGGGEEQVLVIAQKQEEGHFFAEIIQGCGYKVQILGFGDNMKESTATGCVLAVFLIMSEVDDQGVATIIKVKSACGSSSPLIAAGPQWTRKTVLQAVKYGACDILVTPALLEEIKQKIQMHLEAEQPALQANG